MGKWFDQAAEIERLHNENRRLKAQVRSLELRLGVSYGQSGTSDYGQSGAYGDASEYAPGTYGAGDGVVGTGAADYEAAAWLELTPEELHLVRMGKKSTPSKFTETAPGLAWLTPKRPSTRLARRNHAVHGSS